MPVLSSAIAAAVRDRLPETSFLLAFEAKLRRHAETAPDDGIRGSDRQVLRALLEHRATRGTRHATPNLIAQAIGWRTDQVRRSMVRLKRNGLLPFGLKL